MIEPKILKGTNDYGPKQMAERQYVMGLLRKLFESHGYDTIETPVIEYAETILGKYGTEGDQLTYKFQDNGGRDVALRYDQTVPFARYYATHNQDLPRPFKRYQISRVWRADKPQKGREREFYQCDIDVIGVDSVAAELELMQVALKGYLGLGLTDVRIYLNDRRLLNSVLHSLTVPPAKHVAVIRTLDKLDKIGADKVITELIEKAELEAVQARELLTILGVEGTNQEKFAALASYEINEIQELFTLCEAVGIPTEYLVFSPTLARGLDYYTGIIFEAVLENSREYGSVGSGGRYADLCSTFTKESFPGVGFSFGFTRLMEALTERAIVDVPLATDVLVVNFSKELHVHGFKLASAIRSAGLNTEFYFEPNKLAKQFKYANKKEIPFVVIQGEDELANGEVVIKNMVSGDQHTVAQEQLIDTLIGLFEKLDGHSHSDGCCDDDNCSSGSHH